MTDGHAQQISSHSSVLLLTFLLFSVYFEKCQLSARLDPKRAVVVVQCEIKQEAVFTLHCVTRLAFSLFTCAAQIVSKYEMIVYCEVPTHLMADKVTRN